MYEWRDPATGKLKLGDKPPDSAIEYWIEGQKRPEERAAEEQKKAAEKAVQDQKEANRKAEQDRWEAEKKAENDVKHAKFREIRDKKCAPPDYGIRIGIDKETFMLCFGVPPSDINTTQVGGITHEQWVYPSGEYYYFTNGRLTAIQKN